MNHIVLRMRVAHPLMMVLLILLLHHTQKEVWRAVAFLVALY